METSEKNFFLKIAYDGTAFSGWQRQPGIRTVCGELEAALERVLLQPVKLEATSRTDAGVHAYGQQATLRGSFGIPADRLAKAVNDSLAKSRLERVGDVQVLWVKEMPEGFHARFSSRGKRYLYKISNAPQVDLFRRNYCYQITRPLDLGAMKAAASLLEGEHDFAAFMSQGSTPQESTVRTVYAIDIKKDGDDIVIAVCGSGFLYNMVRIMTGTLVEAGLGKRSPETVAQALSEKDRSKAGHVAPPQGLYLDEVFYDRIPEIRG